MLTIKDRVFSSNLFHFNPCSFFSFPHLSLNQATLNQIDYLSEQIEQLICIRQVQVHHGSISCSGASGEEHIDLSEI